MSRAEEAEFSFTSLSRASSAPPLGSKVAEASDVNSQASKWLALRH